MTYDVLIDQCSLMPLSKSVADWKSNGLWSCNSDVLNNFMCDTMFELQEVIRGVIAISW